MACLCGLKAVIVCCLAGLAVCSVSLTCWSRVRVVLSVMCVMPSKCPALPSGGNSCKQPKKTLTLAEKVKILDKVSSGNSISSVAKELQANKGAV